jgi:hypothetical protein
MTQRDETRRVGGVSGTVGNEVTRGDAAATMFPRLAASAGAGPAPAGRDFDDLVDEWGRQSFPASDPPSNW